jgi:type IV secretory pathway VirB2 component (pilin)
MQLTGLDRLLWAVSLIGNCALLAVLLVRRRAPSFPIFTTLISMNVLRTVVLYFILHHGSFDSYFYTYWTLGIVDVALQFGVAYELARHVFRPLGAWAPDVHGNFLALVAVCLAIACGLTWLASPPTHTLRVAIVLRGTLFSSALMSELFVAMVALSVTMGLPWRTHVARLAQGLGIYSIFTILTEAGHSYFAISRGPDLYKSLSHLRISLYLVCVLYWIVTLAMNEPPPRKLPDRLHEELRVLQGRAALVLHSLRTLRSS